MLAKILKLIDQGKLFDAYKEVRRIGKITKDFSFENQDGSYRLMNIFFELTDFQVQMYNGDVVSLEINQRRF